MKSFLSITSCALAALLLTSCVTPKREKDLQETLQKYEMMIRWSQWDAATDFIAPEYLEEHPLTRLDMDRLHLFRVTQYIVRTSGLYDDGNAMQQQVEIHLYNKNRALEQTVMDQQEWKWDAERQRWMLESGLPDVTRKY